MVIAACGIDGSGKTTVLSRLAAQPDFRSLRFASFNIRESVKTLRASSFDAAAPDFRGHALCEAYADDFLRYERRLRLLRDDSPIISDRWAQCVIAFCDHGDDRIALRKRLEVALDPVLILHFTVSPDVAFERIRRRDGQRCDKSLDILRTYARGYERELALVKCPVVRISKSQPADAVHGVRSALNVHLGLP